MAAFPLAVAVVAALNLWHSLFAARAATTTTTPSSQLQNFTHFWHTVAAARQKKTTTMEMTSAIAAAVCSAGPKNGSVVRSLRLGGWGDGLKSLTLTMKFATMPRVY